VGAIGGMICFTLQAYNGLGRHRQTISPDDYLDFRKYNWAYSVSCAVVAFSLLKISIALSLLPLSRARWYAYTLWGLIAFIVSYTIVALGSFFFHCRPMTGSFNDRIVAKCYPRDLFIAFSIMNTTFNMLSDVVCATLPVPIIWTLKMKLRTRVYLICVLSLGYVTVGMGGVKAFFQLGTPFSPDSQFAQDVQFFGFLQINLGIIVACAPTLRPLLGRALKLSSSDKYYDNYYAERSRQSHRRRTGTLEGQGYDLEDMAHFDKGANMRTTVRGGERGGYDKGTGNRSGSEEIILQGTESHGILRTTEIDVRYPSASNLRV
jgi:hypothetical protein